jgi:hypothetical protein
MSRILLTFFFLLIKFSFFCQVINGYAGSGYCCGSCTQGGAATLCSIYYPTDVACDVNGNIYIAEANRVRKVTPQGLIYTIAGSTGGYSGDGGPASAALLEASALTVDNAGNIYIADWYHDVIRKINTNGIISTITSSIGGYSGDGGPAINASINGPYGIRTDAAGNIYISDSDNRRIRKISTNGIMTTIAGNGSSSFSGDGGPALQAGMDPFGIDVDGAGNIYFADTYNNRIRKINTSGIITTIAGTGTSGFSGDGGPATSAELKNPNAVRIGSSGEIFISDMINQRIRKINSAGIITTIAGGGSGGPGSGNGGLPTLAQFVQPMGLCLNSSGSLFIADKEDHTIRYIDNVIGIPTITVDVDKISLSPNPTNGKISISFPESKMQAEIADINGNVVASQVVLRGEETDLGGMSDGVYFVKLTSADRSIMKKLILLR